MVYVLSRIYAAFWFAALLSAASLATPAHADSDFDQVSEVSILPGWQRADGFYMAAVQIDLEPGWKTYWRAPGDNGIAPIFDWSASDNVAQVGYFWPSPHIMDEKGIRTIGYRDRLVLPVLLRPRVQNAPMTLRLRMDYGVCDDICLPARDRANLAVDRAQVHNQGLIDAAMARRATPATSVGLQSATCNLRPDGEDFVLNAEFGFDGVVDAHRLVVVETGSDQIWVSEADHTLEAGSLRVEADLQYYGEGALTLDRSALRFTMLNDGHSIEIAGCSGS